MNITHSEVDTSEDMFVRSRWEVVFLLDRSSSMETRNGIHRRIDQLNVAMPAVLGALRSASEDAEVDLYVRIIAYNNRASWVMGCMEKGVPIEDACNNWRSLSAVGGTDTAAAIRLACTAMHTKYLGTRTHPPVVILVTDGNSDNRIDTQKAIEELRNALSGGDPTKKDKIWRFAIGVEGYNEAELLDFAMLGTKEDNWGNELSNEPMIFATDNSTGIAKLIRRSCVLDEDDDYEDLLVAHESECPIIIDI